MLLIPLLCFWFSTKLENKDVTVFTQHNKVPRAAEDVPAEPQQEDEWKQIRINIDTDYLNGYKMDSLQCAGVGQQISWRHQVLCTENDILTQERKDALSQTLENVEKFLTKLLKVKPYDQPIERKVPWATFREGHQFGFRDYRYYDISYRPLPFEFNEKPVEDVDLYVPVLVRPYPAQQRVPVTHETFVVDNITHRPLLASLIIDASNTPSQAEDENSENPYYFNIYLREMLRILGFESAYFDKFHPYENNDPHSQIFCTFTKDRVSHKLLVTPYAKIWAQRHYGVQTIENCSAGIEIEGNGLKSTMFFTEIMAANNLYPVNGKFLRLTDATLAVLQDSGNYKCDWQLAQSLLWGHKESIDNNYISGFATGPSIYANEIPKGATYATSFDYKYYGKVASSLVNPDSGYCPSGQALLPSTWTDTALSSQKCGEFQCWGFDSFTIEVLNNSDNNTFQTVECTKNNIGQTFEIPLAHGNETATRQVTCPNPERFCRTMRLYGEHLMHDPFNTSNLDIPEMLPHPTRTPMPTPDPSPSPSKSAEPTETPTPLPTKSPEPPAPTKSPKPSAMPTPSPEPTVIPRTRYIIPSLGKISVPTQAPLGDQAAAKGGELANNNNGSNKKNYNFIFIIVGVLAVVAIIEVTFVGISYRKKLQNQAYKDEEDAAAAV